jgi:probable biosynthetic protein (TIGR04098 family)
MKKRGIMDKADKNGLQREFVINMPQMAFNGLSEQWMLKDLGDMHWAMLCDSFGCQSDALTDSNGNRLYSSFVRVRFQSSVCLQEFNENDKVTFKGHTKRFGNKMFFSNISVEALEKKINASLMTVFVERKTDNKSLTKAVPAEEENCKAQKLAALPEFANEYFNLKKGILNQEDIPHQSENENKDLTLGTESFSLADENLFSANYEINPYTDLNGVNLLYFAAYPLINDTCERKYFHQLKEQSDIKGDWALESSVTARDIFYFGNCDVEDRVSFKLNSCDFIKEYKIRLVSSLIRERDNTLMAKIFTIKQLANV